MTTKELEIGKKLYSRVHSVYAEHPEYKTYNKSTDRFSKFARDMSEKYGTSVQNIVNQIKYYRLEK